MPRTYNARLRRNLRAHERPLPRSRAPDARCAAFWTFVRCAARGSLFDAPARAYATIRRMRRHRPALTALVLATLVATGCGSDDDDSEPKADKQQSEAAQVQTTGSAPKPKPKAKKGVRAEMVECIEGELGFEVAAGDADPNKLDVDDPKGKLQTVIVIHNDAGAARSAVDKTLAGGKNAVVFGRAELIRHGANDTETGVIANCVAAGYNRP
jgi:hypothetical protein